MFYSLISKIPYLTESVKDYRMFKVFLVGSVLYLVLHYFLYSGYMVNINYKWLIYPIMIIDFSIAYWLLSAVNSKEQGERERREIARDLETLRMLQKENEHPHSETDTKTSVKESSVKSQTKQQQEPQKPSKTETKEVRETKDVDKKVEPVPSIPTETITSEAEVEPSIPLYPSKP